MLTPETNSVVVRDASRKRWLAFFNPVEVVTARRADEVVPALQRVTRLVERESLTAAGFLSYEAAPAFDSALTVYSGTDFPLLWFGLYPSCRRVSPDSAASANVTLACRHWQADMVRREHERALQRIRTLLEAGDTYQVNYTYRLRSSYSGDPWTIFPALTRGDGAPYGAFVRTEDVDILSLSPELFFAQEGEAVTARPMKGTASRGRTLGEDRKRAADLAASTKERAENVMIVDMIRNDLGRVALPGTVRVPRLFEVETYPTVLQMTSTVEARTKANVAEMMQALFPCASITGAPKKRTMEIIRDLETTPRHVYTGSIGFFSSQRAQFNVAIRTALFNRRDREVEYGTGGGIVWDSNAQAEYRESIVKTACLTPPPSFRLLETLRWEPGQGCTRLERHLQRMQDSAAYFHYPWPEERLHAELEKATRPLSAKPHKLRLLLSADGTVEVQAHELMQTRQCGPVRVRLAPEPIDARSPFLYHKTTRRDVYEGARAAVPDCDDVLLWNRKGQLTESTIANVVVRTQDGLFTPPVDAGLLAGTLRNELLDQGVIRERTVNLDDIGACDEIFLINSLRGWRPAALVASGRPDAPSRGGRISAGRVPVDRSAQPGSI